jgi:TonB family protein
MNDLAMLDRDDVRLADGSGDDPAAILLRSARSDAPDKGSKDRVRAMLGLAESAGDESSSALPLPMEVLRARRQRKQHSRVIEPFIPFQNLTLPARSMSTRKLSGVLVASLQVAAILAALFIRPFPKFEKHQESVSTRKEEPQMWLFALQQKKNTEVLPSEGLAKNTTKPAPTRAKMATRANAARDVSSWRESVVTDEHAGSYAESPAPKGLADTSSANDVPKIALHYPPSPVAFQADMTHPVRISGTDPTYPTIARIRNVSGTVVMRCTITVEGVARNCMILKSPAYLDEAMLDASRTWRFTPATEQGRPVSVYYVFKAKFQLR